MPSEIQEVEDSALRKLGGALMVAGLAVAAFVVGLARGQAGTSPATPQRDAEVARPGDLGDGVRRKPLDGRG